MKPKVKAWFFPVAGIMNAVLIAMDVEMRQAYYVAMKPTSPWLPSMVMIFGILTSVLIFVGGLDQIIHGLRKKSIGIRVGTVSIATAVSPYVFLKTGFFSGIGRILFDISGYGSLDFYYSPIFYLGLLIAIRFFGVTRNLPMPNGERIIEQSGHKKTPEVPKQILSLRYVTFIFYLLMMGAIFSAIGMAIGPGVDSQAKAVPTGIVVLIGSFSILFFVVARGLRKNNRWALYSGLSILVLLIGLGLFNFVNNPDGDKILKLTILLPVGLAIVCLWRLHMAGTFSKGRFESGAN